MQPKFSIPTEFEDDLRYVEPEDRRSDQEILEALSHYAPITSEKNIWTFWDAGVASMPAWCQRNVNNWARLCPSWTVRLLNDVPESPNYALKWVSKEWLPDCFTNRTMEGPWTGPHSADFLRGPCLHLYGGAWLDVGCILVRTIEDICWNQLGDPDCPFTVAAPWAFDLCIANYFVAARKGDLFVKHWHAIFLALWKGQTSCKEIGDHPLLTEVIPKIKFVESRSKLDFKVSRKELIGYVGQIAAWARLCMIEEPDGGFNGREYYHAHVMLFDALGETSSERLLPGFNAGDFLRVLRTKLDADPHSAEYQTAYKIVWGVLTTSSMQKVAHGKGLTRSPQLGLYLDQTENANLDVDTFNFFELLRYGSVHYKQLRNTINVIHGRGTSEAVIRKGILEP